MSRRLVIGRRPLVVGAVVLLAAGGLGCNARAPRAGGATSPKAKEAVKLAEGMAVEGVAAGALNLTAHHPELHQASLREKVFGHREPPKPAPPMVVSADVAVPPAPPPPAPPKSAAVTVRAAAVADAPPRPTPAVLIRERVTSRVPQPTPEEADADAVSHAQDVVEQKLREQDPPVHYRPPAAVVRHEYLVKSSRVIRDPTPEEQARLKDFAYGDGRKYVEFTVEVTAEQVRELRTGARLGAALRVVGGLAAAALAAFLFLRLDEWTRGYLTSWLAFAAVGLAGGVAAALVLV